MENTLCIGSAERFFCWASKAVVRDKDNAAAHIHRLAGRMETFMIAPDFTRPHAVRASMTCQVLIRLSTAPVAGLLLVACEATPQLDHREVSSRLKAGLASNTRPLTPRELADQKVYVEATIAWKSPESVPMSQRDGMPHVPARLNGRSARPFLVDTGSHACVLEARSAVAHRVSIIDESFARPLVAGTTGDEPALIGIPQELSVGSWTLKNFPFVVRTYETRLRLSWRERKNLGREVIGMNAVLRSCNYLTFDFPAERVIFGAGGTFAPRAGKGVWKAPLLIREGRPFVQLQTNKRKWLALIDTGFNGLLDMDKATAQRLGLLQKAKPADAYRFGVGAPVEGEPSHYGMVSLPQLDSLGPRMLNVPTLIVPELSRSKIGCALLRPFRVTLDFRRGLLWLEDV
jgi:hypothetical protein